MRIDILTLFPEMFAPLQQSIIKRAVENGLIEINITNIRDYTTDKHHITDDRLYGGGAGMVMKPEPIFSSVDAVKKVAEPRIIITSPQGRPFNQKIAQELAQEEQIIIICGHYEGIDERVLEFLATDIISVGDFVLTGGEIPAMAIADAVSRLVPGVLGHEMAAKEESFNEGLLEYPQYTRPAIFQGLEVPEVLLGGNHSQIAAWRRRKSLQRTLENRPDLLEDAVLTPDDLAYLEQLQKERQKPFNIFVALIHYPVYNKKKHIINTSLTNLDLHDIARTCATYDVDQYYIVQSLDNQKELIFQLLNHWQQGFGARYNPDRQEALSRVQILDSITDVEEHIKEKYPGPLYTIATSAKTYSATTGYRQMRRQMEQEGGNYLLLLGTGWGLTDEIMEEADFRLRPIYGRVQYNHLSVRSAASIMLDRLLGEKKSR
ncbi:MAG: tRNA (guanosine(37)-N1)-methyltransferase TrmD [Bacillota bacterium]|jgi:tRNA (guanine37-N1)-methyltransferase